MIMGLDNMNIFKLIEASHKLPNIPISVIRALNILSSPTTLSIDELVECLSDIPNLEQYIIHYLNNGYFKLSHEINSSREAVIYLGMETVKNIIISFIIRLLLSDKLGGSKVFSSSTYWRHCIATSVASFMISEKIGIGDKYKLFTYGLIHDIGISVLDICLPEMIDDIYNLQLEKKLHSMIAERTVLHGLTHEDIGAWLCDKWNLPDDIKNIILFHHRPLLSKVDIAEIKIMHLADTISTNYYERLIGINTTYMYENKLMESIGISESMLIEIRDKLNDEMEKAKQLLNMQLLSL